MVDFASLAALAVRLISKNGRDVTLVQSSQTPDNPAQPWRGTDGNDTETVVRAAITNYDEEQVDGDLIRRGDRQAWVAADSGVAIEDYDYLVDGTVRWKIIDVNVIKPATVTVAYGLQLRR